MTPVKQTKFHSDTRRGNCFAAAIATLLDMPLHAVPELEESDNWHETLFAWLDLLGYEFEIAYNDAPKGFAIAGGISSRGVKHAVIVQDGQFVFDPHPSNTFVEKVSEYWTFSKDV
jgi:hypothetical protein